MLNYLCIELLLLCDAAENYQNRFTYVNGTARQISDILGATCTQAYILYSVQISVTVADC